MQSKQWSKLAYHRNMLDRTNIDKLVVFASWPDHAIRSINQSVAMSKCTFGVNQSNTSSTTNWTRQRNRGILCDTSCLWSRLSPGACPCRQAVNWIVWARATRAGRKWIWFLVEQEMTGFAANWDGPGCDSNWIAMGKEEQQQKCLIKSINYGIHCASNPLGAFRTRKPSRHKKQDQAGWLEITSLHDSSGFDMYRCLPKDCWAKDWRSNPFGWANDCPWNTMIRNWVSSSFYDVLCICDFHPWRCVPRARILSDWRRWKLWEHKSSHMNGQMFDNLPMHSANHKSTALM